MRIRVTLLGTLLTLAACGGGSAAPQPDGPVTVGVIAGNNQVVSAGRSIRLPQDVVAQAVRLPSGQVALRVQLLNALLPAQAQAQTAVNGVPGVVVCGVSPDPKHPLVPEVPCTSTGADGKAYFTFHSDSVAGRAKAEVRGTIGGVTVVTDSVIATVLPSVVDATYRSDGQIQVSGDTVRSGAVRDRFGNAIAYRIVSDSLITVPGATAGTADARRITFTTPTLTKIDRPGTIVDANGALVARMRYSLFRDGTFSISIAGLDAIP